VRLAGLILAVTSAALLYTWQSRHEPTATTGEAAFTPKTVAAPEQPASSSATETTYSRREPSIAERSAALKLRLRNALSRSALDLYVTALVDKGLAPSDSDTIVQKLLDGLADCHFEATWHRYEARGMALEDFVNGAEQVWDGTPERYQYVSAENVASNAPECVANVAQRAGVEIAAGGRASESAPDIDFGIWSEPNLLTERASRAADSPDWSDQMAAKLYSYILHVPNVPLTDLRIKCEARGCMVLLNAEQRIDIFGYEFDRFGEENGFASVTAGSDVGSRRLVTLLR
jgi:hypothetical protein